MTKYKLSGYLVQIRENKVETEEQLNLKEGLKQLETEARKQTLKI